MKAVDFNSSPFSCGNIVEMHRMNISEIDCLILAGGKGERIANLLPPSTPKFLAPIYNKPFADYFLRNLENMGINRAVLALSHKREIIIKWINEYLNPIINTHYDW